MQSIQFHGRAFLVADTQAARAVELAVRAARTNSPVLVCGESGTGKELISRLIHEKSPRGSGPFVSVNCAAIPEGLLEAELFGFERGAFTGALQRRVGKFELASGGTILLDEISEMPVYLQAKLLRVLQEGEIDRLGSTTTIPLRARVLATTNRDPVALVREGRFREDLYFRLNVIRIDCPPLRARRSAISALTEAFALGAAERHGLPPKPIDAEALALLEAHEWPGNVRELQNAVERAVIMTDGDRLGVADFDLRSPSSRACPPAALAALAEVERTHILTTLEGKGGNRMETARSLGISVRTLRNKIKEFGAP